MKDRVWKWRWFAIKFTPGFWLLALGAEFKDKGYRGFGIGVGPLSLHFGEVQWT
jgi:hypothetical protein